MDEVEAAKKRCEGVIERIASAKIIDSCKRTLLKLTQSELAFLSRLPDPNTRLSVNIGHLEAVVHILQHPFVTAVSRVCKPLQLSAAASRNGHKKDFSLKGIQVDIVCTVSKTPVWIIVSDRNPKYISWHGSHKTKGLKSRVEQVLVAARSTQTLTPSSIIHFFSNGISHFVREKLQGEFGAAEFALEFSVFDLGFSEELGGEWINVLARSYKEACVLEIKVDSIEKAISISECGKKDTLVDVSLPALQEWNAHQNLGDSFCSLLSQMKCVKSVVSARAEDSPGEGDLVNFDTTALIALVSGISNGCADRLLAAPEAEMRQRFKGNYEFVIAQVMSEIKNPVHAELSCVISGKRGMICESVLAEFKELVSMCGGPNEKYRAEKLLKYLMVVADSPSERMRELPTTRKLALKNKIVFGTGDYWHAPTMTANMAFVRAVAQTGMSLFTIEHRPRALTGD